MRSSLRDYLKRAHGVDERWYRIDPKNGREFVKIEFDSGALWYVPSKYNFFKNFLLRRAFGIRIHDVFDNLKQINIKKDILEIYPGNYFYANFEPRTEKFGSFDRWLDIEEFDAGGIRNLGDRITGLWVHEKDSGQEYHIDFPLLSYIDHIYVDDEQSS